MPGSTTDTVPTMLTPGEFVIKRESAKMLGKPLLEQLNAVSDNSSHSNINSLISQETLAQMQPMMGGGVVSEYMGGGSVDNYMYGGGVMDKKKKKKAMAGYQDGGSVSDATATSAMDELIAQAAIADALKENPQSRFSMVDADRVDAEENTLMDMILSMAIPGAGVFGTVKGVTGKLPKLAKKFASMRPDKGKQKVLDKIASTMKVAPGRKIEQTSKDWLLSPASKKLDMDKIKGYRVLENTLNKPFDKMDLINPGYLQKFTNKLVKVRDKPHLKLIGGKDVKVGDVVDALFNRGFHNENELKRIGNIIPKKYRKEELEKLLKMSKGSPQKIGGYENGGSVQDDAMMQQYLENFAQLGALGAVGNSFVPFDQRQPGAVASGRWGESGAYNESLEGTRDSLQQILGLIELDSLMQSLGNGEMGELIERKPESSDFLYSDFDKPKMSSADSAMTRNLLEYLSSQIMQGRDSSDIQRGIDMDSSMPPGF